MVRIIRKEIKTISFPVPRSEDEYLLKLDGKLGETLKDMPLNNSENDSELLFNVLYHLFERKNDGVLDVPDGCRTLKTEKSFLYFFNNCFVAAGYVSSVMFYYLPSYIYGALLHVNVVSLISQQDKSQEVLNHIWQNASSPYPKWKEIKEIELELPDNLRGDRQLELSDDLRRITNSELSDLLGYI